MLQYSSTISFYKWSFLKFPKVCLYYLNDGGTKGQRENLLSTYFMSGSVLCSVQFSFSVISNSLQPHELQHARPPCPSQTPGVHPNPCPSTRWCHPTVSSSVFPFSSCAQSFPGSGSLQVNQLFISGGQSVEFQLQHQSLQWTLRTGLL